MQRVVLGKDMGDVDRYTIQNLSVPSLVLMERAAYQTFLEIKKYYSNTSRVLVVSGKGNNGADGIAIARMLHLDGWDVALCQGENETGGTKERTLQMEIYHNMGGRMATQDEDFGGYDLIVDAIFGVGLKRPVEGFWKTMIERINQTSKPVVSVDVPSGVDATSGKILGVAVKAERTTTFGAYKTGLLLYPGAQYAGWTEVLDIGFSKNSYAQLSYDMFTYDMCDIVRLPKRSAYSNKGTYGKLSVVAGSKEICGAAVLSAMAAYRAGAGIVRVYTAKENRVQLQTLVPEALVTTYEEDPADTMEYGSAIVIGPGLGTSDHAKKLLELALKQKKKTVLDADALNIISANKELTALYHEDVVITPHLGEMARLVGKTIKEVRDHLILVAASYAKEYNITVVLKDARTIVTNGTRTYLNRFGNSGMATGGSGDVLSGICGALVMSMETTFEAACMAVFLHSLCGDRAALEVSEYSLMARNLIEQLEKILEENEDGYGHFKEIPQNICKD